jgi:tetratricopeptide (TPR) repeat protein
VEEKQRAKEARLEVYHKVVAAQPDNAGVLADYAWYCAGEEIELDKALAAAKKAVELKPKDTDALATLAEVTFKSGKPAEAVDLVDRALLLSPGDDFLKQEREKFSKALQGEPKN